MPGFRKLYYGCFLFFAQCFLCIELLKTVLHTILKSAIAKLPRCNLLRGLFIAPRWPPRDVVVAGVIALLLSLFSLTIWAVILGTPQAPSENTFSVLTYDIRQSMDSNAQPSLGELQQTIRNMQYPQIIGLQESDNLHFFTDFRDPPL